MDELFKCPKLLIAWVSFDSQYHGGTNFGKSAAAYVITGYYDQSPLDEYGRFLPLFLVVVKN